MGGGRNEEGIMCNKFRIFLFILIAVISRKRRIDEIIPGQKWHSGISGIFQRKIPLLFRKLLRRISIII